MESKMTVWDFVEEHFPNYYRSNLIAESDDLSKLLHDEQEDGDSASIRLYKKYKGDIHNRLIELDYNELMVKIYEHSIQNYYDKQNNL